MRTCSRKNNESVRKQFRHDYFPLYLPRAGVLIYHSVSSSRPTIVPRPEHSISRKWISPNALRVLYRLKEKGYLAYLVGGGVRDLLLGREPKDFDIATDAKPNEVKRIFRNCRLIGRRFRLAHVHFHDEIIEVAAIAFDCGSVVGEYQTLVRPAHPPPYQVQRLTGISATELETAPPFAAAFASSRS